MLSNTTNAGARRTNVLKQYCSWIFIGRRLLTLTNPCHPLRRTVTEWLGPDWSNH
jgi:hypothetical protein